MGLLVFTLTGNRICAIPRFDNSILSAGELGGRYWD